MPQVTINTQSPNFTLPNFQGEPVSLSDFFEKSNVVLVFNRTFN